MSEVVKELDEICNVTVDELLVLRWCLELSCDIFEVYANLCPGQSDDVKIHAMLRPQDRLGKQIIDELVELYFVMENRVKRILARDKELARIFQYNLFRRFPNLRAVSYEDLLNWKKKEMLACVEEYVPETYSGESLAMMDVGEAERLIIAAQGALDARNEEVDRLRSDVDDAISRAKAYRVLMENGGFDKYWLGVRKVKDRTQLLLNDALVLANLNEGEPLRLIEVIFNDAHKNSNQIKFNFKNYKTTHYGRNAEKIMRESWKLEDVLFKMFALGTNANSVIFRGSVKRDELIAEGISDDALRELDLKLVQNGVRRNTANTLIESTYDESFEDYY